MTLPAYPQLEWSELARRGRAWVKEDGRRAVTATLIGFAVGWGVSLAVIAFDPVPGKSVGTFSGNFAAGGAFFGVLAAIVSALAVYGWQVGWDRLRAELFSLPAAVWRTVREAGRASWSLMLWAAALALLISGFVAPAVAGVVGVGFLLAAPSPLASLVGRVVVRLWTGVLGAMAPLYRNQVSGLSAVFMAMTGSALAMMFTWPVSDTAVRLIIAGVAAVAAYAVLYDGGKGNLLALVGMAVAGWAVWELMQALPALAQGCCGSESHHHYHGLGLNATSIRLSSVGGLVAAVGTLLGSAAGGVVGAVAGAVPPPPSGGAGPASGKGGKTRPKSVTEDPLQTAPLSELTSAGWPAAAEHPAPEPPPAEDADGLTSEETPPSAQMATATEPAELPPEESPPPDAVPGGGPSVWGEPPQEPPQLQGRGETPAEPLPGAGPPESPPGMKPPAQPPRAGDEPPASGEPVREPPVGKGPVGQPPVSEEGPVEPPPGVPPADDAAPGGGPPVSEAPPVEAPSGPVREAPVGKGPVGQPPVSEEGPVEPPPGVPPADDAAPGGGPPVSEAPPVEAPSGPPAVDRSPPAPPPVEDVLPEPPSSVPVAGPPPEPSAEAEIEPPREPPPQPSPDQPPPPEEPAAGRRGATEPFPPAETPGGAGAAGTAEGATVAATEPRSAEARRGLGAAPPPPPEGGAAGAGVASGAEALAEPTPPLHLGAAPPPEEPLPGAAYTGAEEGAGGIDEGAHWTPAEVGDWVQSVLSGSGVLADQAVADIGAVVEGTLGAAHVPVGNLIGSDLGGAVVSGIGAAPGGGVRFDVETGLGTGGAVVVGVEDGRLTADIAVGVAAVAGPGVRLALRRVNAALRDHRRMVTGLSYAAEDQSITVTAG